MEKKVKIGEREFTIHELLYKDVAELTDIDKKEMAKRLLLLATDITEEEYNTLSMRDGLELQKTVNELNKLDQLGFQNPVTEVKKE